MRSGLCIAILLKTKCFLFQVDIVGTIDGSTFGDIAIDDILLKAGACSKCYFIIAVTMNMYKIFPNDYYAYNMQAIISLLFNEEKRPQFNYEFISYEVFFCTNI